MKSSFGRDIEGATGKLIRDDAELLSDSDGMRTLTSSRSIYRRPLTPCSATVTAALATREKP